MKKIINLALIILYAAQIRASDTVDGFLKNLDKYNKQDLVKIINFYSDKLGVTVTIEDEEDKPDETIGAKKRKREEINDDLPAPKKRKNNKDNILESKFTILTSVGNFCMYLSPNSKKHENCIYTWVTSEERKEDENRIPSGDRIKIDEMIKNFKDEGYDDVEALYHTMLEVEKQLIKIAKPMIETTIYVGQTKSLKKRKEGHKKNLEDPLKKLNHPKVKLVNEALNSEYHVRISTIAHDAKEKTTRDIFEALIYYLTGDPDGCKIVANDNAWKVVKDYLEWDSRKRSLNNDMHKVIEKLRRQKVRRQLFPNDQEL